MVASGWFFCSAAVDFVAIPTVFKILTDNAIAGKIGVAVFKKFNLLEIVFALALVPAALNLGKGTKRRFVALCSFALLPLPFFYRFYLTPKITETAHVMNQFEEIDPQQYVDAVEAMDFYLSLIHI